MTGSDVQTIQVDNEKTSGMVQMSPPIIYTVAGVNATSIASYWSGNGTIRDELVDATISCCLCTYIGRAAETSPILGDS